MEVERDWRLRGTGGLDGLKVWTDWRFGIGLLKFECALGYPNAWRATSGNVTVTGPVALEGPR